jgi:polar amino acid transport system permease protein
VPPHDRAEALIMESFAEAFLHWPSLKQSLPLLLSGLRVSALLVLYIVPVSLLLGLVLAMLWDLRIGVLNLVIRVYVDLLRSFPPLVLLIFLYSGLPFLGLRLNEMATVVIGLVLNGTAFFTEIWRAGIAAVAPGQRDAARATGLGTIGTMLLVVLPQAARKALPALTNNLVELTKATSLAAVVAIPDLMRNARTAQDQTYNATPVLAAALIYLVLLWPAVRLLSRLELRMVAARRPA